jgi:hypothetical protein
VKIRQLIAAAAAGLALLSLPAAAQDRKPSETPEALNPDVLKGIIREDDVGLLFRHLRESMAAAARGEQVQESEALKRRAEQLQRDLTTRGTALLDALLTLIEAEAKRALREAWREPAPRSTPGT